MANRNDSDARQHETLPGPGPGASAPIGGGGRPVEQMVDAAIERLAREQKGSAELSRRSATEAALARRHAAAHAMKAPTRLRWKGLDVSEEFRQYAERVASGEELPPFEGRVLAEPNSTFPWGAGEVGEAAAENAVVPLRGAHPVVRGAVVWGAGLAMLGLLGWSIAVKLAAPEPNASVDAIAAPRAIEAEQGPTATPPDLVEARTLGTPGPSSEPAIAEALVPLAESGAAEPGAPEPAEATPASGEVEFDAKVSQRLAPAGAAPSVRVDLARPGALGEAVGAALASRNATASGAPVVAGARPVVPSAAAVPAAAGSAPSRADDEFGIMAAVGSAPTAAAPPGTPAAVPPAPAGAKSNGSVGDLARVGQPGGPGVRKEPGSESSAKGSLLIETPSF